MDLSLERPILKRDRRIEELFLVGSGDRYLVKTLTPGRAKLFLLPTGQLYVGLGDVTGAKYFAPAPYNPSAAWDAGGAVSE